MTSPHNELRHRRTKIIATLGPSTTQPGVEGKLVEAGIDVVRLNFSHGTSEEHQAAVERIRDLTEPDYHLSVLGDLQGPKIRITKFADGPVTLSPGEPFILDPEHDPEAGTAECVGLTYPQLAEDLSAGDNLLLDDGRLMLRVREIRKGRIYTEALTSGILHDSKGINREGGGLSAPSITAKDLSDIRLAARIGVDYLAVSYPRNGETSTTPAN